MFKKDIDFIPLNSSHYHVAVIPDGARRWANCHHLSYRESYDVMCQRLKELIEFLYLKDIEIISVYFSSMNNFKRPSNEVMAFCNAERDFIMQWLPDLSKKYNIRVKIAGIEEGLNDDLKIAIKEIEEKTKHCVKRKLFLCINYSSLHEISLALHKMDCSNSTFVDCLDIPYPVNLLIRTGDANVLSDFLLPQCASARLFFLKELFNDLQMSTVERILEEYRTYDLKYGE